MAVKSSRSEKKQHYDHGTSGWTNPWNGYTTAVVGTVAFNSFGGSPVVNKVVEVGNQVAVPEEPTRKGGYKFDGWYKEPTCENPWNFDSNNVTGNITLYAKWNVFIDKEASAVLGLSPIGTNAFTSDNIVISFSEG